jgi:hypothetical protein
MADRMIRKQVYLEPRQERLLKARARQLGVTEAEVIRQSLERALAAPAVRRRMRLTVAPAPRTWTRDELYDRPRALR